MSLRGEVRPWFKRGHNHIFGHVPSQTFWDNAVYCLHIEALFFFFPTNVNCPTFVSMFNQCSITSPVNSKWMSARVVAYFLQWVESTVVTLSVCRSRQQPSCLFTVLCCRTIWKALVHVSMTWEDIELTHIHFLQSYFNPSILTPDPPNTVVFGKFYI